MKYPNVYLINKRAHNKVLNITFTNKNQHQNTSTKIIHATPNTTSNIFTKSISKNNSHSSYHKLLEVAKNASNSHSKVIYDALLLNENSHSNTYPTIQINKNNININHKTSISKINKEQLFYLITHKIPKNKTNKLIMNNFIEPIVKKLPMEYTIEMNHLIELQIKNSIN